MFPQGTNEGMFPVCAVGFTAYAYSSCMLWTWLCTKQRELEQAPDTAGTSGLKKGLFLMI